MAKHNRLAGVYRYIKAKGASTANLTVASALVNGLVHDGVTYATGDVILLKNQSSGVENGLYVIAASGAASRDTRWPAGRNVAGYAVRVYNGTVNKGLVFACYAEPAIAGTNDPGFIQHERMGV